MIRKKTTRDLFPVWITFLPESWQAVFGDGIFLMGRGGAVCWALPLRRAVMTVGGAAKAAVGGLSSQKNGKARCYLSMTPSFLSRAARAWEMMKVKKR